jgi:hypothetical protein
VIQDVTPKLGEAMKDASMESLLKIQKIVFEFRDAVYRIIAEGKQQD